ncbi:MAG: KH domain-containing protein [Spirochaetaceae bacterium]|jgi:predicted RNA-binding protein YlqC (UPF0109 family)|nr:KH domain-containing protein [Spirochaetaceae bacterium]
MERELIEYVVRSLVENPDGVQTNLVEGEKSSVLEIRVDEGDEGRIIGKRGRIAKALRALLQAATVKSGKRVVLEILG